MVASRKAYRGHCTPNRKQVKDLVRSDEYNYDEVESLVEAIKERMQKIKLLDDKIQSVIGADEIEDEVEEVLIFDD